MSRSSRMRMIFFAAVTLMGLLAFCSAPAEQDGNDNGYIASGSCGESVVWGLDADGTMTISGKGEIPPFEYAYGPWTPYAEKIKSIVVKPGITGIGSYAFFKCSSMESITLPSTVTHIENEAFLGCLSLTSVYAADLESWMNISFNSTSGNPMSYADRLYLGGLLAVDLVIPDHMTGIGAYTFYGCKTIKSVKIGANVTSIGDLAFSGCSGMTSVTIPERVTGIKSLAFYGCSSLTSVTIPDSVTSIKAYAFFGCSSLESIIIPDSVTSIGNSAFGDCSRLKATVGRNSYARKYCEENGVPYRFPACRDHTVVTLAAVAPTCTEGGWTEGRYCAVCNEVLADRESVAALGHTVSFGQSIYEATAGSRIQISAELTCGHAAALRFMIPGKMEIIQETGDAVVLACGTPGVVTIAVETVDSARSSTSCTLIIHAAERLVLPGALTHIEAEAFRGAAAMEVVLSARVTRIGEMAFAGCKNLTLINLPDEVLIGQDAFAGCDQLTIICTEGSAAQRYAEAHAIPYVAR